MVKKKIIKTMPRLSGVLLHISSLPSPYGIGTLGKEAYRFIRFLHEAGQTYWQILPLGTTGFANSPYQNFSIYAGNPYFIDFDLLVEDGLLQPDAAAVLDWGSDPAEVDYGLIYENKKKVLFWAYEGMLYYKPHQLLAMKEEFVEAQKLWLEDYATFMVLKEKFSGESWQTWPEPYRLRDPQTMEDFVKEHQTELDYYYFEQFIFHRQWSHVRQYAEQHNIKIIGDLPIYVAPDSVDVWADPELFQLNSDLEFTHIAGCPPDLFTPDGQLWGNPLYDWQEMEQDGFSWWLKRMEWSLQLYDYVRIDHFRGFESYWSIPYGDPTARFGKWIDGPGEKLFKAMADKLGEIRVIAEDLGFMTDEVIALRKKLGFPGMSVLQFAFDPKMNSTYLPHNLKRNNVIYAGTHDNSTTHGWFNLLDEQTRSLAIDYFGLTEEEGYTKGFIRGAMNAVSNTCILTMQDLLDLDETARMNLPGSSQGNWEWRLLQDQINPEIAADLRKMTYLSGRLPVENQEIECQELA
ncbi:MAG: 4-alpha-glucanotransferase [Saccharofermentanales bacterium]|jgi:4-alpha-glucanotransferase